MTLKELRQKAKEFLGGKKYSRFTKQDSICALQGKPKAFKSNQAHVELQTGLEYCERCYMKNLIKRYEEIEKKAVLKRRMEIPGGLIVDPETNQVFPDDWQIR